MLASSLYYGLLKDQERLHLKDKWWSLFRQ